MNAMQATEAPRLERSVDDRLIAGVCGGIAEHFAIDATIVRIAAVVLTVFGGAGILLYIVAWAMLPEVGQRRSYADSWMRHPGWQPWIGVGLIIVAFSIISDHLWHIGDVGFPVFLIGIGAFLLFFRAPERLPLPEPLEGETTTSTASTSTDATATAAATPEWRDLAREQGRIVREQVRASQRDWHRNRREWHREIHARRRARRSITVPTIGVLALGAGIVGLVIAVGGSVRPTVVLAIGLVVIGVALVLATKVGRAGGLVPLGLLVLAALSVTAAIRIPFGDGGIGNRREQPGVASDIPAGGYHQAIGELDINLNAIKPTGGNVVHVDASVGIGHMLVTVPRGVEVVVHGHSELGDVRVNNEAQSFWKVDHTVTLPGSSEGGGRIDIDATVGIGEVEVQDA